MAKRRTTYGKLERDRAKKAKAAAKRERRQERSDTRDDDDVEPEPQAPVSQLPEEEVLARLAQVHERFDAGDMTFEQFQEEKDALLELLHVG